jgi:ABC-type glycerol-3-phosphate transport system substrate-binding protein
MLIMLKYGYPMFPAFANFTQANDLIGEQIQQVMLGRKSPEQAMKDAEAAVGGLLPK